MKRSFDHHGLYSDVHASVPSEGAVIDPRGVGNYACKVDHHCTPNAHLVHHRFHGKTIVVIEALRDIEAGEYIFIEYKYVTNLNREGKWNDELWDEEFDDEDDYDMDIGTKRSAKLPIVICACNSEDCCLTL